MKKLFGTDGVRGIANKELTCELTMNLGRAAGMILSEYCKHKPVFIIGKDTRISSDMLESSLVAGICSVGADVIILGVVPTPAVAFLVKKYNADAGFMISASHNPMEYNGIKIFNNDGYKLQDEIEAKIENLMQFKNFNLKYGSNLGRVTIKNSAVIDYIEHIKSTVNELDFSGIKIAVDCANGSASTTAKQLFSLFNVNPFFINNNPDGININQNCGSTHMKCISNFVKENNCDIGFAFDGDADRCLIVDENGEILDGDKIIAILSKYLKENNKLAKNTFVVTVMSNLGLLKMAKEHDINVEKTKVGDRYVLEKMLEYGYCIGGESSGHIILSEHSTTGDGQLVAIQFLKIIKELNAKVSELSKVMDILPQILINVHVSNLEKYRIANNPYIIEQVSLLEKELGENGRILLRPSGTEPLIRVMVEGTNNVHINKIANQLSTIVKERFGI